MRIWDISPSKLCKNHLLGEHRELHAMWAVITEHKKGYSLHPETLRWNGKLKAMYQRHEKLVDEMKKIGSLMRSSSHCGLGATAANCVLETLEKFPSIYQQRLKHTDYEPAFDLDAALQESRDITGRDDEHAHIRTEP